MKRIDWYFDYISPYAYLQLQRLGEFAGIAEIRPVPVLFAGLLNATGNLGGKGDFETGAGLTEGRDRAAVDRRSERHNPCLGHGLCGSRGSRPRGDEAAARIDACQRQRGDRDTGQCDAGQPAVHVPRPRATPRSMRF